MVATHFQVQGMSCQHCEQAVRLEVSQVPGVRLVKVDAVTGRLVVESDGPLDEVAVLAAVELAGYQVLRPA